MKPTERFGRLIKRYENDPEYLTEGLLIDITEQMAGLMKRQGLSRSDLARRLNCSNAYVTKLMSGSQNLTLKKLSQIGVALGCSVRCALVQGQSQERQIGMRRKRRQATRFGPESEAAREVAAR